MRLHPRAGAVGCSLLVALVAGCGAPSPAAPSADAHHRWWTRPSVMTARASTPEAQELTVVTPLDRDDLLRLPVGRWPGPSRLVAAGAPVVVADVGPDGTVAGVETGGRHRILLRPRHGPQTAVPGTAEATVRYVDVSRRWVAWTESTSRDYFSDRWTLHVLDRQTGRVRVVARARQVAGHGWPTVPDGSVPVLDGDRVVIAEAVAVHEGRTVADVIEVSVHGGRRRVLVRDAIKPDVVGGQLVVVRAGWAFRHYRVRVGGRVLARGAARLTGLAVGDGWVAWSEPRGTFVRRAGGSPVQVLEGDPLTSVVAAGDHLVGAVEGAGGAVLVALDVGTGEWTRVGRHRASGAPWVAGRWWVRDVIVRGRSAGYRLGRLPPGG